MLSRSTTRYFLPPVAAAMLALSAIAEETSPETADKGAKPVRGRRPAVAEIDREAVGFARAHHPELADLLEKLHHSNPRAYRAAIQDLARERTRLERLQERAPERYEFELKLWTMDSRLRLLAARAIRGNADEVRPQLQALLQERHAFRLSRLRQEQERLKTRSERVAATIEELENHPPSTADVDALLTRVKSRMPAGKPGKNASGKDIELLQARPQSAAPSTDTQSQTDSPRTDNP
jgi:hypothetical protein